MHPFAFSFGNSSSSHVQLIELLKGIRFFSYDKPKIMRMPRGSYSTPSSQPVAARSGE